MFDGEPCSAGTSRRANFPGEHRAQPAANELGVLPSVHHWQHSLILVETLLFWAVTAEVQTNAAEIKLVSLGSHHESEQRFRLVANTAPVMIWMSGPTSFGNYSISLARVYGGHLNPNWPRLVAGCIQMTWIMLEHYTRALIFANHSKWKYPLRRHDGEFPVA